MHILLIPSWYKTSSNPHRGNFFTLHGLMHQKAGYQVGMLVPPSIVRTRNGLSEIRRYWKQSPNELIIDNDDGYPTYRVPWWGWFGSINPFIRYRIMSSALEKYIAAYGRPDLLHAHSLIYGGYIASVLSKKYDIPYIVTEQRSTFLNPIKPVHFGHQFLIKRIIKDLPQLIVTSDVLAKQINSRFNFKKTDIIGNPIDTDVFKPNRFPSEDNFIFTIIGGLISLKGHEPLLHAFGRFFKDKPVKLRIIGDGPLRAHLKEVAIQIGIESQCEFLGRVNYDSIPDHINRSHVIVSASAYETFGMTMIEAMACGKPIVATRSGGADSKVDSTVGLLVNQDDFLALGEAMQKIYTNYSKYNPNEIRKKCIDNYSEAAIMAKLDNIYQVTRPGQNGG